MTVPKEAAVDILSGPTQFIHILLPHRPDYVVHTVAFFYVQGAEGCTISAATTPDTPVGRDDWFLQFL